VVGTVQLVVRLRGMSVTGGEFPSAAIILARSAF
jgi:hypothetical protein